MLVKAGFGLGALSRWRALHEVAVISSFIAEHGEGVAARYIEHLTVERWRQLSDAAERANRLGEPFDDAELSSSQADVGALADRHGRAFLADYGWASDALQAMVPPPQHRGFRAIEAAADFGHLRLGYRKASAAIHAGPAFVLEPPDAYHFGSALLTGPTLVGIAAPVHSVAISLVQVTAAMMTSTESWAAPFVLKTMLELADRTGQALSAAEVAGAGVSSNCRARGQGGVTLNVKQDSIRVRADRTPRCKARRAAGACRGVVPRAALKRWVA